MIFSENDMAHYDGLEVAPVCYVDNDGGLERCPADAAGMWTVYGHCITGGVCCLDDFNTEGEAKAWAEALLVAHPCLTKYGLHYAY